MLGDALRPMMRAESAPRFLGMLLSLSTLDTSLFQYFDQPITLDLDSEDPPLQPNTPPTSDLDSYIAGHDSKWQHLHIPDAIVELFRLFYSSASRLSETVVYIGFRTIDRITAASHRNQALLNKAGLITPVFDALYPEGEPATESDVENSDIQNPAETYSLPQNVQHIIRKTLRRLLDIGFCSPSESWRLFRSMKALDARSASINSDVLGVVRSGSKSKWPEFFSFQHSTESGSRASGSLPSTLEYLCEGGKAFPPPLGFTFLVRWISRP